MIKEIDMALYVLWMRAYKLIFPRQYRDFLHDHHFYIIGERNE